MKLSQTEEKLLKKAIEMIYVNLLHSNFMNFELWLLQKSY